MNFFYKKKKNLNENSLLKGGSFIQSVSDPLSLSLSLSLSLKRSSPALFCHQASTHVRSLLQSSFSSLAILFFPALFCDQASAHLQSFFFQLSPVIFSAHLQSFQLTCDLPQNTCVPLQLSHNQHAQALFISTLICFLSDNRILFNHFF